MRQDSVRKSECHSTQTDGGGDLSSINVEARLPTLTPRLVVSRHCGSMTSSVMTSDDAAIATTHSRPSSSLNRYVSA